MSDIHDPNSPPCLPRRAGRKDDPRMIGGWKIGRTIGKGSSGRVKIARHSKTGQYAAIKIVSKTSLINSRMSLHDLGYEADRILLSIEREIVIMKLIDHPNIMRLYDVWETSGELYLILEYVEGGELFEYLCERGRLPATEALNYFQQIVGAIDYCHRFNIAHRDLKPENLLLDKNKNIKVADFGMAAWQNSGAGDMLETSCGSPHYAAPEVVMGKPYDGSSSDIWSCGVILFALLAGRLPFDDENIHNLLDKVKLGKYTLPADIDPGAQDLIAKMLEKDITKRFKMEDILTHSWYISQPPKNVHCAPATLEEIARPVANASEIDADIFGNMKTLWHGAPDEDIIDGLVNDKQTWEKGIYHLLLKYRSKHMEDYNGDEDEGPRLRKRSKRPRSDMPPPLPERKGIQRTTSQLSGLGRPRSPPPARPDPPTPRRATHQNSTSVSKISKPGGPPPLPLPPRVNPLMPAKAHARVPRPLSPAPQPSLLSPSMQSPTSPTSPVWEALNLPPINGPELQDESVQLFFRQIVEHLDMMQRRPSTTSGASTDASASGLQTPSSDMRNGNTTAPPPTPASENFQLGNLVPVNSGPENVTSNTRKTSDGRREPALDEALGLGILTEARNPVPARPAPKRPGNPKPKLSDDKENGQGNPSVTDNGILQRAASVVKKSSLKKNNTKRAALTDRRVQIVLPAESDHDHSRRRSLLEAVSPTLSNDSFLPSPSAHKRSWFGNIFKFKPASYQLLSTHDATSSREECRQLLVSFGVRAVVTQSEGLGLLKCKLDEIRDPAGVMAVTKAVQFRVELHACSPTQAAGNTVSLTMVQEKGALSSFKLVYERLRREWVMDVLRTPLSLPSPALTAGGRFAEMIYPIDN